jgi:hypothetical protein
MGRPIRMQYPDADDAVDQSHQRAGAFGNLEDGEWEAAWLHAPEFCDRRRSSPTGHVEGDESA